MSSNPSMAAGCLRVDYHFHPNFPLGVPLLGHFLSRRKARRIWRAFSRHGLHLIFVSEHVYKRPRRAYEFLQAQRPGEAGTHLVPAVEYLTSEGVDIIVFAEKPEHIYCHRDLLTPWKLSAAAVVQTVLDDAHLQGIVVHPCTPGATSILRKCGKEFTLRAIGDLGFLEVHNCSNAVLQEVFTVLKLEKLLHTKYQQIVETKHAPSYLRVDGAVCTGGSDAHFVWEIGDCMEISVEHSGDFSSLFALAVSRSGSFRERERRYKRALPLSGLTVLYEWLLKKTHLYTVDEPL